MEIKDKQWTFKNTISIRAAARNIGVKVSVVEYRVQNGDIESKEGRILKSTCEEIKAQKEKYIGLKAYIMTLANERFIAKLSTNRNKYIDFLELNDYFGVTMHEPEGMLFATPDSEIFYFEIEDAEYLRYKSIDFLDNYGLTEEEKCQKIIKSIKGFSLTKKYLVDYINTLPNNAKIYTPAFTLFVELILSVADVHSITDEDVIAMLEDTDFIRTKEFIVNFYNYVAKYEVVKYNQIELKKKEHSPVSAYSDDKFVALASMLFNQTYDEEHNLTIKALENHIYAEMWLFLSMHYVCGWRSADICNNWVYLDLKDSNNPFHINPETLYEDIINGVFSDKTLSDIALYSVKKIEMSFNVPNKTNNLSAGKLRTCISPDLRVFFGKLNLIAEYHHFNNNEGYMKQTRTPTYQNWTVMKEFFGERSYEVTGRQHLSSRKLNKSYLQGIEISAREDGNTSLVAHAVASLARNHMNINTTVTYLKDHGLSGETAEVVLYMMMQRGVMGVYLYKSLIAAFPEQFEALPMKEQTKLMEMIPLSAYELESGSSSFVSSEAIYEEFKNGETEEALIMLKAMYEIGQGRGKGKDSGIYCKKKALGYSCVNPTYESCIANICPYHVFTSEGVPALIRVIKEYNEKLDPTGKNKYKMALNKHIMPAFQDIINEIIKNMPKEDSVGLQRLITEEWNG